MHEVLILGIGFLVGTTVTLIGGALGAHLVMRTYMELTQPHLDIPNTVDNNKDNTDMTSQPEGYDWDEYDNYLTPPIGDDGEDPKA